MSKNCAATPLDAGPHLYSWLIFAALGRRTEQSLNAERERPQTRHGVTVPGHAARLADLAFDLQIERAVYGAQRRQADNIA